MLVTGDLSKTISLRPSKPNWNGLHGRIESGKTMNIINSLISVIVRGSGELKVATERRIRNQ